MEDMKEAVIEKRLLEALVPDLPGLVRVEKRAGGLGQELVLVFVDGSQASIPILGGLPAPETPESPFGRAIFKAWWRAKAEELA
jgi:hypothetical protein